MNMFIKGFMKDFIKELEKETRDDTLKQCIKVMIRRISTVDSWSQEQILFTAAEVIEILENIKEKA